MGTRGFVSAAVLSATAGLLIAVAVLGGYHRLPPTTSSSGSIGANLPSTPSWSKDVMKKQGGAWVVSWGTISDHINTYKFDGTAGEHNHRLLGDSPVFASIAPVAELWTVLGNELFPGHVIAEIESSDKYTSLGLMKGKNYLFVWQDGKSRRLAILNELGRQELKFKYAKHGDVSQDLATSILGNKARNPGRLSVAALTCISKGWKACFVDSQKIQSFGSDGAPGMMGLMDSQGGGGGSQPWVACVLYGCCCGGTQCHKD